MAATLSSLNVALERVWTDKTLQEQLYQGVPFLEKIEKLTSYSVGENARVPLHVTRNGGYTALPAGGGTLNTAGNQGLAKAEYNWTNHHYQIQIQGDAIDGTKGSNAIVEAADIEIKGALTDLRRQLNRQLFMKGDALIAQCRTSATNDVDLNTSETAEYSGVHALTRGWIYVNQQVDVGTTADEVAIVDGSTVTAVDTSNTAFTSSSGNVAGEGTTHYVSAKNSRSGTTSYEMNGLRNLVSASDFAGITVSSTPSWSATVNSTDTTLTLAALLNARTTIYQNSGEEPDFFLTSPARAASLYQQFQQQIRYSGDNISVGNIGAPKYLGMELWQHPDCQDTDAYVGQWRSLFIVSAGKPAWQNKVTGGQILEWVQGTDQYGAKLSYRLNLGARRRNTLLRFSALTA